MVFLCSRVSVALVYPCVSSERGERELLLPHPIRLVGVLFDLAHAIGEAVRVRPIRSDEPLRVGDVRVYVGAQKL